MTLQRNTLGTTLFALTAVLLATAAHPADALADGMPNKKHAKAQPAVLPVDNAVNQVQNKQPPQPATLPATTTTTTTTTTVAEVTADYIRDGRAHSLQLHAIPADVAIYRIHGPFLFGSTDKLLELEHQVDTLPRVVILRLRNMTAIDGTGLHALEHLAEVLHANGRTLLLVESGQQFVTLGPAPIRGRGLVGRGVGRRRDCKAWDREFAHFPQPYVPAPTLPSSPCGFVRAVRRRSGSAAPYGEGGRCATADPDAASAATEAAEVRVRARAGSASGTAGAAGCRLHCSAESGRRRRRRGADPEASSCSGAASAACHGRTRLAAADARAGAPADPR